MRRRVAGLEAAPKSSIEVNLATESAAAPAGGGVGGGRGGVGGLWSGGAAAPEQLRRRRRAVRTLAAAEVQAKQRWLGRKPQTRSGWLLQLAAVSRIG